MPGHRIATWFECLLRRYGPLSWWPGDSAWEIMLGAVLVQRTTWANASRAMANLRHAGTLHEAALSATPQPLLEELLKPAGFFRLKARRVSALLQFVQSAGGADSLARWPTAQLRAGLLGVHGVGAETADAILLYAFERPVFVVDAYARRLLARLVGSAAHSDDSLRALVSAELPATWQLNELHALIVTHGQRHCRPQPRCAGCCLAASCAYWRAGAPPD